MLSKFKRSMVSEFSHILKYPAQRTIVLMVVNHQSSGRGRKENEDVEQLKGPDLAIII